MLQRYRGVGLARGLATLGPKKRTKGNEGMAGWLIGPPAALAREGGGGQGGVTGGWLAPVAKQAMAAGAIDWAAWKPIDLHVSTG